MSQLFIKIYYFMYKVLWLIFKYKLKFIKMQCLNNIKYILKNDYVSCMLLWWFHFTKNKTKIYM